MPVKVTSLSAAAFMAAYEDMLGWLLNAALPRWASDDGVDRVQGGFFEKIAQDGRSMDGPRRTRVVARQIFSFLAAQRMGWGGDIDPIVEHGLEAFYTRCLAADGLVVSVYRPGEGVEDSRFDFYDHAFALFALGQVATLPQHRTRALSVAHAMLAAMRASFAHPARGFAEDAAHRLMLRANPHMHMLEACLALAAVEGAGPEWRTCADEIVLLALDRLICPESGALREFFDFRWQAVSDDAGQLIEPGHQFEWAWLLRCWNAGVGDARVEQAASAMIELAERQGIDRSGRLAVDALDTALNVKDASFRLWPQTERLKAAVQAAEFAGDEAARGLAYHRATLALSGMQMFLNTNVAGLWHDRLKPNTTPRDEPAPASTLYHIVCALETCHEHLAGSSVQR